MPHERSLPDLLTPLLFVLAFGGAGCAGILTNKQIVETTVASEVKTNVTEKPALHLRATSGSGEASVLSFRLAKYGECQKVELRTVRRTEVVTRTMTRKGKAVTAVLYTLGIVGGGLLATGLAMDGDYTRKLSEEELQEARADDPDASDTEWTGKTYLVASGAVLTPFFIGGIVNSARAHDSENDLGVRIDRTVLSEGRCEESVPSVSEVVFFAPEVEGREVNTLRAAPNADGNLSLPRAAVAEVLCGSGNRSVFRARYAEGPEPAGEVDVTEAILPACNEILAEQRAEYEAEMARREEEARLEAERKRAEAEAVAAAAEAARRAAEAEAAAKQQARWDKAQPYIDAGMRAVENGKAKEAKRASTKAASIAPDNPALSDLDAEIDALEEQLAVAEAERKRQAEVRKKMAHVQSYIQQCKIAAKRFVAAREAQARAAVAGNPAMVDKTARQMEIASEKFSEAAANIRLIIETYNEEGKQAAARAVRDAGRPCLGY